MNLQTKLQDDMKAALKAGQKDRLSVIRMMLSDVKNIDLNPAKPTAEDVVAAYAKRLRKSIEEYEKLGKPEEVKALRFELSVAEEYLPKKASAEETETLVEAFLTANAFTARDIGKAMGAFMKAHGAGVDAAVANAAIKKKLTGAP